VIQKMGIAEAVKAKALTRPGGLLAELLVSGEAELAIQHVPELMAVKGIEVVGPFPPGLDFGNVLAAGVFTKAGEPIGAAALIDFLTTPAAARLFESEGLRPLF
jgi:molybdate transport system substrate-binding protein